jgi:hypothetical protein
LDRDWGPGAKILNKFLSANVLPIPYGHQNIQNLLADFRSEGGFQKKCMKKDNPENLCFQNKIPISQKTVFDLSCFRSFY